MKLSKEEREKKIEEGLKQIQKFTWEKCTEETLQILK